MAHSSILRAGPRKSRARKSHFRRRVHLDMLTGHVSIYVKTIFMIRTRLTAPPEISEKGVEYMHLNRSTPLASDCQMARRPWLDREVCRGQSRQTRRFAAPKRVLFFYLIEASSSINLKFEERSAAWGDRMTKTWCRNTAIARVKDSI